MHMLPRDVQESNERRFSRKHINGYIDTVIRNNPNIESKVQHGADLLTAWVAHWTAPFTDQCKSEKHHTTKSKRLSQLATMDLEQLVRDLYVGIAYVREPELFVSVTSQLASKVGFDDKASSIQTVAEIVAILCEADGFDIIKRDRSDSLMIQSCIPLPLALQDAMDRSLYLPPLVCEPDEVKNNFESPYLTHNDCLILGKGNSHTEDICLDTINTQNAVALRLDTEFLSQVEEEPSFDLDTSEKIRQWTEFKSDSYELYEMLTKQGNRFHLANKVDKRGRKYAQGYHITTQGSAFKKAMLELANEEIIEGVPA